MRRVKQPLSSTVRLALSASLRRKKEARPGDARFCKKYLTYLGARIEEKLMPIHATPNHALPLHGWAPYVQGFSAKFVLECLANHAKDEGAKVLDPFAGSGTVALASKWQGIESCSVEYNPLLHFIAKVKSEAHLADSDLLKRQLRRVLQYKQRAVAPDFLATQKQFGKGALKSLEEIKGGIESMPCANARDKRAKDILRLALAAILVKSSRLVRTPCLTYNNNKRVSGREARDYFALKVQQISGDIDALRAHSARLRKTPCKIIKGNSMLLDHSSEYDLVVTSPPYMNGMDYVINYKIEMSWLGFTRSQRDLKSIKNSMVACDNISRGLVREDSRKSPNEWVERIKTDIADSIRARGYYRRDDMPDIMKKYFCDMRDALTRIAAALRPGGKMIMVVGDSLIAGVYVPTDLILARMCMDNSGMRVKRIEKARNRRSGQKRDYQLRETVIVLEKAR